MNPTLRPSRCTPPYCIRFAATTAAFILLAITLAGCKGTSSSGSSSSSADANQRYMIGPDTASELGLRILWQQQVPLGGARGLKRVAPVGPDLVTVDTNNRLTMLRLDDGYQIWHAAPLPRNEAVLGLDRIDTSNRNNIFVTTDTDIFVVDANTGHMTTRQDLKHQPSTGVARIGPDLVFGSANGRVIWHNAVVGYEIRANQMNGAITATPQVFENDVIAVSAAGQVMMMSGGQASRIWARQLTGGIRSQPAVGNDAVYVAGLGQSLWCLDLNNGSVVWKYFTQSPLSSSPTLLGDRVFQYVPSEGLVCLDARPQGSPQGKVLWRNTKLKGEVVTVLKNDLVLWDESTHEMTLVDADRGDAKTSVKLDGVDHIDVYRPDGTTLIFIASSNDGKIQRLVPLGR